MDLPTPHLLLIGPRGAGKTTLGRLTAERLGRTFIDLDEKVREAFGGASIKSIFDSPGREAFRECEVTALKAALAQAPAVIALGGGAPMTPAVRAMVADARLRGRARVVYLAAEAETLQARLREADLSDRPSLTGSDPIAEVPDVLLERKPIYTSLADRVVQTEGHRPEDVAGTLADMAAS